MWIWADGRVDVGEGRKVEERRPRGLIPGPSVVGECVELGDRLETANGDADRIGLVKRNRSADDLCDEVVAGSCDPDVPGLIDCECVARVQVGRRLLEAGCG